MKCIVSIVLSMVLMTQTGLAQTECEERKALCEETLDFGMDLIHKQHAEIVSLNDTLYKLNEENADLVIEYAELVESQNVWYRNPFIIGILGASIGVLAIEVAR